MIDLFVSLTVSLFTYLTFTVIMLAVDKHDRAKHFSPISFAKEYHMTEDEYMRTTEIQKAAPVVNVP